MQAELTYPLFPETAQLLDLHGVPHDEFQEALQGKRICPSLERDRFQLEALMFVMRRYEAAEATADSLRRIRSHTGR